MPKHDDVSSDPSTCGRLNPATLEDTLCSLDPFVPLPSAATLNKFLTSTFQKFSSFNWLIEYGQLDLIWRTRFNTSLVTTALSEFSCT